MTKSNKINYGLGLMPMTVSGVRGALSAVFKFALEEGFIAENPVSKTKIPPLPLPYVNPLSIEEAWAFTSVKDFFWYGNAHVFDLQTGLRPQELMALIWDDVDFEEGTIRIERACIWLNSVFTEFGKVKCRRSERVIELAPEHIEFLKDHQDNQNTHIREMTKVGLWKGEPKIFDWIKDKRPRQEHLYKNTNLIFPNRSGYVPNMHSPRRDFKAMLKRAGLTDRRLEVRWYDLRHTHATFLLTMGEPPHEVAARLGHTVDVLFHFYAHVLKGRQRKASKHFVNLVPLKTDNITSAPEIRVRVKQFVEDSEKDVEEALSRLIEKTR